MKEKNKPGFILGFGRWLHCNKEREREFMLFTFETIKKYIIE